jgi:hypothetical protein
MQQRLFDVLRGAPEGLTCWALLERVYSGHDDTPARNVISVMVKKINPKLAPLGLRIKGTGGPGSVYRLLREEVPPCAS